jgi:hypothetical protein
MDLSIPIRLPGLAGLVGRVIAYLFSGELVVVMWLIRPTCPLRALLQSPLIGYRTRLFVISAAALLLGILLHTVASIVLSAMDSFLDWLGKRLPLLAKFGTPLSKLDLDFLNKAHAAMEEKIGEPVIFRSTEEFQAMRTLGWYFMQKFPDLQEPYLSEQVLVEITMALVPALFLSLWITARDYRYWTAGAFVLALMCTHSQVNRLYRVLARNIAVGYLREKSVRP